MNVLIVYASQFGSTKRFAMVMGDALAKRHAVRVVSVEDARELTGDNVDLLLVGAPTQIHGLRLLARPFLATLRQHAFVGVASAAFDTRMEGPERRTGSAARAIGKRLVAAGCPVVAEPVGFVLTDFKGVPRVGEDERAIAWALTAADRIAVPV